MIQFPRLIAGMVPQALLPNFPLRSLQNEGIVENKGIEENEANKAVVGRLEAKIQELQVDLKAKNKLIDKMTEAAANDFSQNQALSAAVQHHKSLA